jgi:hypothetical protein
MAPPLDLLLWHPRTGWLPIEVKDEKGKFTPSQKQFIAYAQANKAPYAVWRTLDDVLETINKPHRVGEKINAATAGRDSDIPQVLAED